MSVFIFLCSCWCLRSFSQRPSNCTMLIMIKAVDFSLTAIKWRTLTVSRKIFLNRNAALSHGTNVETVCCNEASRKLKRRECFGSDVSWWQKWAFWLNYFNLFLSLTRPAVCVNGSHVLQHRDRTQQIQGISLAS